MEERNGGAGTSCRACWPTSAVIKTHLEFLPRQQHCHHPEPCPCSFRQLGPIGARSRSRSSSNSCNSAHAPSLRRPDRVRRTSPVCHALRTPSGLLDLALRAALLVCANVSRRTQDLTKHGSTGVDRVGAFGIEVRRVVRARGWFFGPLRLRKPKMLELRVGRDIVLHQRVL